MSMDSGEHRSTAWRILAIISILSLAMLVSTALWGPGRLDSYSSSSSSSPVYLNQQVRKGVHGDSESHACMFRRLGCNTQASLLFLYRKEHLHPVLSPVTFHAVQRHPSTPHQQASGVAAGGRGQPLQRTAPPANTSQGRPPHHPPELHGRRRGAASGGVEVEEPLQEGLVAIMHGERAGLGQGSRVE